MLYRVLFSVLLFQDCFALRALKCLGHESPQAFEYTFDESEDAAVSDHEDEEYVGLTKTPGRVSTRSMEKGTGGLKEIPAEHLHLESHPFATGWSGNVVRGMYEGVAIAVNLHWLGLTGQR